MDPLDTRPQERVGRSSLRLLAARLCRRKGELAIGFLGLFIVDGLQLAVPKLIQHAVDALAQGAATVEAMWLLGGALVAISIAMGLCRFVWRYFIVGASHKIERDLRQDLYDHLQTLPPEFYDRTAVGDIMAHASNDIAAVRMATGIAALAAFDAAVLAVAAISIMLAMHPALTAVTLLPLPFLTIAMLRFGSVVHIRFAVVQQAFSRLTEKAHESFSGIRVIKAYGDTASEERSFADRARACADQNIALARVWSLFGPFIAALALASMAILLGAGGRLVIRGSVSLGEFVAFSSYLAILVWPMMAVGWVINLLQRGTASMDRLEQIFRTPPQREGGTVDVAPEPSLRARGLAFAYPGTDREVLRDISFTLPAGGTLGIAGSTGAGKTTIAELFLRLYDPPRGALFVGGIDVCDLRLSSLRRLFGYVPQETFLFNMSVADNIAFGADGLSRADIEELARAVDIHDEIAAFLEGYDTIVGERGVTLSGGQRQRIAIARALATRPRILILDDALSSCDTETEAAILSRLRAMSRGRTTVLISHRISTLRAADLIIVLDEGRIVDAGTHEELVSRESFYAKLFRVQELEAEARRVAPATAAEAPDA